jgi:hypothetical protein
MINSPQPDPIIEDQAATDALVDVDPADAPAIADAIAANLQRELDGIDNVPTSPTEPSS